MTRGDGCWEIRYTAPAEGCVIWYSFLLHMEGGDLFYGPCEGKNQGEGKIYWQDCPSFQLTVYTRGFTTPRWFRGSTMYQIFPDRFCQGDPENLKKGMEYHKAMGRKAVVHEKWDEPPLYEPLDGEEYYSPCDFYGGDLRGIINSLDYLERMGVGVLYLNPVVESDSNHRYNTADYMRVDPVLGSNADFAELCQKAAEHGIRVMMDGVYSHTGSDSRYFNKLGNYSEPGAFQGPSSPYYKWYTFYSTRYNYKSWWGFDTLPEVNELDKSWQRYIITGRHSVFSHWTQLGVSGIRLDVADELPDEVIALMRSALKRFSKENVLLGEVWEDATTKKSYDKNRRYALGSGLDSVMNYPFKDACVSFLLFRSDAYALESFLLGQKLNYPKQMYYALMNLLSSHDVPRIRTLLATGQNGDGMDRPAQAAFAVSEEQDARGRKLEKLAVMMQFFLPGVPSVYYGDEFGMQGLKDPFNRGPLTRRDEKSFEDYKRAASLRRNYPVLRSGQAAFRAFSPDLLGLLRFNLKGADAFSEPAEKRLLLLLVNRGDAPAEVTLSLSDFLSGLEKAEALELSSLPLSQAVCLSDDKEYAFTAGRLTVSVAACDTLLLELRQGS